MILNKTAFSQFLKKNFNNISALTQFVKIYVNKITDYKSIDKTDT